MSAAVAAKLGAKPFVGGDEPSAEDVKLFNELLGENNAHLHRWVKHMSSFTEAERKEWPEKAKQGKICSSVNEDAKPKIKKSAAAVVIKCKSGADVKSLEGLIRQIKVDGLDFGTFAGTGEKLTWKCVFEDDKVSKQDLMDMTVGFKGYVEAADVAITAC
ncbi:25 kDa elongation factor 1-beta [Diplonema papillatum]|nr:25 kDa elongation factor 1-beta [Diplonema papillatum]